jgi:hypothetical protein
MSFVDNISTWLIHFEDRILFQRFLAAVMSWDCFQLVVNSNCLKALIVYNIYILNTQRVFLERLHSSIYWDIRGSLQYYIRKLLLGSMLIEMTFNLSINSRLKVYGNWQTFLFYIRVGNRHSVQKIAKLNLSASKICIAVMLLNYDMRLV